MSNFVQLPATTGPTRVHADDFAKVRVYRNLTLCRLWLRLQPIDVGRWR